ncbi:MAG: DNA topoisomerase VI subunit B [Gammaproteobacteria bacterium]|jgi:DNA topoisomerase-6 subunit B
MTNREPTYSTATEMAGRQRDISVAEFFLKNRHLLGFDSQAKALLTTVREAVDNALDACEEAGILPDIRVQVIELDKDLYRVVVEDNGPGILENQIARIFGKLLYGSKFHKLAQSRGQQGMGISAAGMYAQLTTGKSLHVISRVKGERTASELHVSVDTTRNRPLMHGKKKIRWDRPHGTRIEAEMEGRYQKGAHSVDMYLKQSAIANPHARFRFEGPHGEEITYERSSRELPPPPVEIKPHPRGVELGRLIQMLNSTQSRHLLQFLQNEFSRVGPKTAREIIRIARRKLTERSLPKRIAHAQANALYRAIRKVPVSAPRTDCLVPIGEARLLEGLKKEIDADFYIVRTRPPAVYRGNPFQVEVGIAFGHPGGAGLAVNDEGHIEKVAHGRHAAAETLVLHADEPAQLLRFANRVPLLYEQGGCAITHAVLQTNWKNYGLKQPRGALPTAPMAILVHLASVWVPFTSEAKEAIAEYDEIARELKLGLQECARRLAEHLHRETRLKNEYDKRTRIEKYLPHVGIALQEILDLSDKQRDQAVGKLDDVLHKSRKIQ